MAKKFTVLLSSGLQAEYWRPNKLEADTDIDYCTISFVGYLDEEARNQQRTPISAERAVVTLTEEEKSDLKKFMYKVAQRYFDERDVVEIQPDEENIVKIMEGNNI